MRCVKMRKSWRLLHFWTLIIETDKWWCNCCTVLMKESWRLLLFWTLIIETDKWWCNCCTVLMRESLRFLLFGLYFRIWMIAQFFLLLVFSIYRNIFLLKYSGYIVWDLHTLLDRGNLCHSNVWYILCCLLRVCSDVWYILCLFVVFVSTVTWDFCTALLVACTSKLVCLPILQPFLFGFGICILCHFCSCYILPLFSVFSLSSFSSACVWF